MMSQEDSGVIAPNTRVTVGQLIITMKRQSRCIAHNVILAHYQEQVVEAMLLLLDEQGWPLHALLPLRPVSLADGELCRVMWREQTIALSRLVTSSTGLFPTIALLTSKARGVSTSVGDSG
jgi:hypothetical protein